MQNGAGGRWEVSHLRLKALLEYLQEQQVPLEDLFDDIENINPAVLTSLRKNHWLQADDELAVCSSLSSKYNLFREWADIGRLALNANLSSLVQHLPDRTTLKDMIGRIPAAIAMFMAHISVTLESVNDRRFRLRPLYQPGAETEIIDLAYLKGILDALFRFFSVKGYRVNLSGSEFSQTETVKYFDDECLYNRPYSSFSLDFTEAVLASDPENERLSINTYQAYVKAVLERSSRLLQDKKELSTAVEYLNMANDELEKKIRANRKELKMARNIQQGFVPARIPDWKGLQFWISYQPLNEISGDFYDYYSLGSHKMGLVMGDVSGHGVPAALISAIAKLSFNSHKLDSPSSIFSKVNLDLLRYVKREGYLTGFYILFDSDYNITYSVAASPRPLLFRARTGEVEKLTGSGTLLGMFPDASDLFLDQMNHLEPGDKLIIFTDGLNEATSVNNEMFGEERIIKALKETAGLNGADTSAFLRRAYSDFLLGSEAKDDLTIITIMLSHRTDEFNALVRSGREAANRFNYAEASKFLQQATQIFPRHTSTLFLLGKYLTLDRNYDEAVKALENYIDLKPYNADAYTILAYCAYRLGNDARAIDELKRSISLRSENPSALYNLIKVYMKLGMKEEAATAFSALEFLRPHHKHVQELRDKYFKE